MSVTSPGPGHQASARPGSGDQLEPFTPLLTSIRWAMLGVGLLLAAPDLVEADVVTAAWAGALLVYAAIRTVRPIRDRGGFLDLAAVVLDVAIHVAAVVSTDFWQSPFVLSLITAVVVAGFSRGFAFSLRIATASALAVALPDVMLATDTGDALQGGVPWSVVLLLIAVISGYARRLFGEVEQRHSEALDRLGRLSEANELLRALHRVAQTLPASLDDREAVDSTVVRLHTLVDAHAVVVALRDETSAEWVVAAADGAKLPVDALTDMQLPSAMTGAVRTGRVVLVEDHLRRGTSGFSPRARSGLYAPLAARGAVIGCIAIEHMEPDSYDAGHASLVAAFAEHSALAIDNARIFARLRSSGAAEERTRIARDLHDRVGQSLAYLAFELDRITPRSEGTPVHEMLEALRTDVRGVVTEIRETLYDIRSDVTEETDIVEALDQFAGRVHERSGLVVHVRSRAPARLPLRQEREMWRIAQEALTNVERHARASHVTVSWICDDDGALLEVHDDGAGFLSGVASRLDSYGLVGMKERAAGIGARVDIDSEPGHGTVVRCRLDRR